MADIQGNTLFYDNFMLLRERGDTFELESDAVKVGLLGPEYQPSRLHTVVDDVRSAEVTGNGYSRQNVLNIAVSKDPDGFIRVDGDPVIFTASGGPIGPFKYWFAFFDIPPFTYLIAYGEVDSLNNAPGANDDGILTLQDGRSFQWVPNELGWFRSPLQP